MSDNIAQIDAELRKSKTSSNDERKALADKYGVSPEYVLGRLRDVRKTDASSAGRKTALMVGGVILAGIVLLVLAVSSSPNNQPDGLSSAQDDPQYRDMSPEGKAYVDDQMRQYDAYCGQSPKPSEC